MHVMRRDATYYLRMLGIFRDEMRARGYTTWTKRQFTAWLEQAEQDQAEYDYTSGGTSR
jgi:hypothetical protein